MDDLAPFAAFNADPRVTTFLPAPLTRDESDALATRTRAGFTEHGFDLWAVERIDDHKRPFIGLSMLTFETPVASR